MTTQSLVQDYLVAKNSITGIENTAQGYSSQFLGHGEVYWPERGALTASETIRGCMAEDIIPSPKNIKINTEIVIRTEGGGNRETEQLKYT